MAKKATPKKVRKLKKIVKSKAGSKPKKKDTRLNHITNPYFQKGSEEVKNRSVGNSFYKLRSKHGRERIFADPIAMLDAFEEYVQAKAENPWHRVEYKGKMRVEVPTVMPLTWDGFCIFCDVAPSYFLNFQKNLTENGSHPLKISEQQRVDYTRAIELIKGMIRDQKYNGAAAGYFKEGLITYDLGIRKDEPPMEVSGSGVTIVVKNDEDKELLESVRQKLKE